MKTAKNLNKLGYYYHKPDIKIISPWREWDLSSRTSLVEYADKHGIEIAKDKRGEQPFSIDENICFAKLV